MIDAPAVDRHKSFIGRAIQCLDHYIFVTHRALLGGYYRNRSNNKVLGNVPCYWYVIYITVL